LRTNATRIAPLQSKVTRWETEKDPNKTATFIELRDWFAGQERNIRRNRKALGDIGIANSAQNNELEEFKKKCIEQEKALLACINSINHINDSMENKENAKAPLQTEAAEDLVKRVMAVTENKCVVAPPPKKELTEIEKLTAMVADDGFVKFCVFL